MTSAIVRWWRVALARCRALVRPQTVRDEIEEELRFHIDMRARELVRNGASPADAQRAAAQSFGSIATIKDVSYDIRGGGPVEAVWRDITYGVRSIRKHAALSVVVIGIVAIGVGANATILGVADRVLWRELPVRAPRELVQLRHSKDFDAESYPLYRAMKADTVAFSGVLARWRQSSSFAAGSDEIERRVVELVSGNYFGLLGIQPAVGRLLSANDDKTLMGHAVVVISDRYWRTRLGANESVIGRTIRIDDYPFTIVGVAPPEFTGVEVGVIPDAWVPLAMHPVIFSAHRSPVDDSWMWLDLIARLAPGVSIEQARASAALALQRFQAASGEPIPKAVPRVMQLRPVNRGLSALRDEVAGSLDVLMGLAGLVLLIACANLATLLAIRSIARGKEIGVRLALGASHGRVVRQLFLESMLLAFVGGAIGTVLAVRGAGMLLPFLPPSFVPSEISIAPDARMLVISFVLSTVTGVLFGVGPALRATRVDVASVIRDEVNAQATGRWRFGARRALVVGQVALSLVLVIGAGLFARSLVRLTATPAGFDVDQVVVASVEPSLNRYRPDDAVVFYRALHDRLAALPGIQRVGMSDIGLLGGPSYYNIRPLRVPGMRRPETGWESPTITTNDDFFGATGIDVVRGRVFDARDTRDAPLAVVLNETAARRYFHDADPVGRAVMVAGGQPAVVVGIVRDSKYRTMRETMPSIIYTDIDQDTAYAPGLQRTLYVRTTADPAGLASAITSAVHEIDPTVLVHGVRTFADQRRSSMSSERLIAILATLSGAVALLLSAVGLYGLVLFDTQRRTREIGVRVALGATPRGIVALVLRGAVGMIVGGSIAGILLSRVLSGFIAAQLYGVSASDPAIVALAFVTLGVAAIVATIIPAWRASRVNPVEALRCE